MYLLDTNILLELILEQQRADEVETLLHQLELESLRLSEFTLYSLGVILFRRKMVTIYLQTIDDLIVKGGVHLIRLQPQDMEKLASNAKRYNLDFDDAYQYTVAEKFGLTLVSFDHDFDKTKLGRKTPAELIQKSV